MTEIANIGELKNYSSENIQGKIVEVASVSIETQENESKLPKGFTPIEAEAGADYQSMS